MICREPSPVLWNKGISFPLERLQQLIANGIWSDPESERRWTKVYPVQPYQLWDEDPTLTPHVTMRLQDIEMWCPWCERVSGFRLADFWLMHVKNDTCTCSCGQSFTTESLSAKRLHKDFLLAGQRRTWYISLLCFLTFQEGERSQP